MPSYAREQAETLRIVHEYVADLPESDLERIRCQCSEYMEFRKDVDLFLKANFNDICSSKCYESQKSACCSRDGIITFFADHLVNALHSDGNQRGALAAALTEGGQFSEKCVYLGRDGCLWHIKPIVCEMFLCNEARETVFMNARKAQYWERLERKRKKFTWPDQPVLFDALEQLCIDAGCQSSLMYLHNSPGLLRVKQRAGLADASGRSTARSS